MNRYRLVYRGSRNAYYAFDTQTNKPKSLGTGQEAEAKPLLGIKNEAVHRPQMNLQIAQVYLQHSDPSFPRGHGKSRWPALTRSEGAGNNQQRDIQ